MKTNTVCAGIILLASQLLFSCSKKTISPQHEKYLQFETIEEYTETLNLVMSMNEEERIVWEKQQGFVSFASHSNQVYETIAEKELPVDELKKEIVPYADYVQLKQEETGDYAFINTLESNPEQFLCNKNRIVQIGNKVYKLFDKNAVSTNVENISELTGLTEGNYLQSLNKNMQLTNNSSELKDDAYKISNKIFFIRPGSSRHIVERRNDSGKNRTRIRVYFDQILKSTNHYKIHLRFDAGAYKKTFGVWYKAKRTISCNINILYDYKKNSMPWQRKGTFSYYNPGTRTYSISGELDSFDSPINLGNDRLHFAALRCWAKTPDTDCVKIYHNTEFF